MIHLSVQVCFADWAAPLPGLLGDRVVVEGTPLKDTADPLLLEEDIGAVVVQVRKVGWVSAPHPLLGDGVVVEGMPL